MWRGGNNGRHSVPPEQHHGKGGRRGKKGRGKGEIRRGRKRGRRKGRKGKRSRKGGRGRGKIFPLPQPPVHPLLQPVQLVEGPPLHPFQPVRKEGGHRPPPGGGGTTIPSVDVHPPGKFPIPVGQKGMEAA